MQQVIVAYQPRTLFVAKTGSDSNTGRRTSPYLTITFAMTSALSGDTIFIHDGDYSLENDEGDGGFLNYGF